LQTLSTLFKGRTFTLCLFPFCLRPVLVRTNKRRNRNMFSMSALWDWPALPRQLSNEPRSPIYWNGEVISLAEWWGARRRAHYQITHSPGDHPENYIRCFLIVAELFPHKLPPSYRLLVSLLRAIARHKWRKSRQRRQTHTGGQLPTLSNVHDTN
jgi:hypothetical protein